MLDFGGVGLLDLLSLLEEGLVGVLLVPLLLVLLVILGCFADILVDLIRIVLDWVMDCSRSSAFLFLGLHHAVIIVRSG